MERIKIIERAILMEKAWLITLLVVLIMGSCNNVPNQKSKNKPEITIGEKCSIKVSDIEFTKSLNGAKDIAAVVDNSLVMKSNIKCDNFNDPDGKLSNNTAPVLLTKIDNTKPFTFITKVTPTFNDTYDAAAMYIYFNPKLWFKFAFERDERQKTRIVTVRTIETSDDNNHDIVDGSSVYMKISSDAKTIGFYYSADKENWQLVRLFKNDYPDELWTGLSIQSPVGDGTDATFEDLSLTQRSVKDFRLGK